MSIPHHSTNLAPLAQMLAAGQTKSQAARTLGITPSAVSQLTSTEAQEAQLKRSSELDAQYDRIEDKLLKQLERSIGLVVRPAEIARTLQIINSAKRRGVSASLESAPATVVQLNLPTTIQNKFTLNSSNQVVTAGTQDLVTIQSNNVKNLLETHRAKNLLPSPEEDEFGFPTSPISTPPEGQRESEQVTERTSSNQTSGSENSPDTNLT